MNPGSEEEKKYIEVGPHVTFLPYIINSIFPNSKFIHLVRKPEKVIISGISLLVFIILMSLEISSIKSEINFFFFFAIIKIYSLRTT